MGILRVEAREGEIRAGRYLLLVLWALVTLAAPYVRAEAGAWTQLQHEDGIRVWRLDVPGKELPGFRGEVIIDRKLEDIVAVIMAVEKHMEWMHRCVGAYLIRTINPDHHIIYNRTSAPWPVWDRDVILDTEFTRSADGSATTVTFKSIDPTLRPLPRRVVRMPQLLGYYRLVRLSPQQTRVVYQVEMDIGGSIPSRMAQRVARDFPFETLTALRARLKK